MWLSVLINPTARRMIASRANTRRPSLRGPAETKGCSQIGRRLRHAVTKQLATLKIGSGYILLRLPIDQGFVCKPRV
jgi:hypothetical protein